MNAQIETSALLAFMKSRGVHINDKDEIAIISKIIGGYVPRLSFPRKYSDLRACAICNTASHIQDCDMLHIFRGDETACCHAACHQSALASGWLRGHHNIIKMSHDAWLVFWRGKCAEVKTRKEAKELLKQLAEGDSTKSGGTD